MVARMKIFNGKTSYPLPHLPLKSFLYRYPNSSSCANIFIHRSRRSYRNE